jgi:CBS domain-containing protein
MRANKDRTAAPSVKIGEVMTSGVITCTPETSAATAAALMLQGDCGILPIVDHGALVGVVTDRDLFIALGTRNLRPTELTVGEVASKRVWTCRSNDEVSAALATMNTQRVRRLPVTDDAGRVIGVLSVNDLVLESGAEKSVRSDALVETLRGICTHHQPLVPRPEHL